MGRVPDTSVVVLVHSFLSRDFASGDKVWICNKGVSKECCKAHVISI